MAGNTLGKTFKLTTFGESHGAAIGGVIDGCPAGVSIDIAAIQGELDRRRPGQSKITTQRKESDIVELLSGIFEGKSTGAPIGFIIRNKDAKSADYDHLKHAYRPSHADNTYDIKYGIRDHRGGGRASARETACRVVGGAVARQVLNYIGIRVWAFVSSVGSEILTTNYTALNPADVESNMVRCPDAAVADKMIALIDQIRKYGDTVGGVVTCVAQNVPAGLGEPVFDRLEADLAKAMLSINATKGFEIGSGFGATEMRGSQHNDQSDDTGNHTSNHAGGVQGGVTNGQDIYFNVAFKPVATLMQNQSGVDDQGNAVSVKGKGRHDPCVVPRAVPIVEAMTLLTLVDHFLRNRTSKIG